MGIYENLKLNDPLRIYTSYKSQKFWPFHLKCAMFC